MRAINRLILLVISLTLLLWGSAGAQNSSLEKIGEHGSIDWVDQHVTATGIGVLPPNIDNPAQTKQMAKRAAIVVARRNLLEVVKGVHIDSSTRVVDFAVADDTILSKVTGVLQNSKIVSIQPMSDGSVQAVVSMPLTGQLGMVLISAVAAPPSRGASSSEVSRRLSGLEQRVRMLETRMQGLQNVNAEQEEMIGIMKNFVLAWMEYSQSNPPVLQAGYGSDIQVLKQRLIEQRQLSEKLSVKLDELSNRLASLEGKGGAAPTMPVVEIKPKKSYPYTGLVIDARGVGFRPCLKPGVFSGGQEIFPGSTVNRNKAIRTGYVRFYRNLSRAQRNARVGSLPYTIRATGTYNGVRSLKINGKDFEVLKAISENPGNFLSDCKVIIVF